MCERREAEVLQFVICPRGSSFPIKDAGDECQSDAQPSNCVMFVCLWSCSSVFFLSVRWQRKWKGLDLYANVQASYQLQIYDGLVHQLQHGNAPTMSLLLWIIYRVTGTSALWIIHIWSERYNNMCQTGGRPQSPKWVRGLKFNHQQQQRPFSPNSLLKIYLFFLLCFVSWNDCPGKILILMFWEQHQHNNIRCTHSVVRIM